MALTCMKMQVLCALIALRGSLLMWVPLCDQHCAQEKGFSFLDLESQYSQCSTLQQGLAG